MDDSAVYTPWDKGRAAGGGRSSRPLDKAGARSQKILFGPFKSFGPQFGLKIRGGAGGRAPRAPPLDPTLDEKQSLKD